MSPLFDYPFETVLWGFLLVSWLITSVFWCITMQRAMERVPHEYRDMPPVNVWLVFVPFFGLYWQFAVVSAVANGLGGEYARRQVIPREARPGYSSGMTAGILFCCGLIPVFGILVAIASNIPRLIHLARIKNYCTELDQVVAFQSQFIPPPPPPAEWKTPEPQRDNSANPERYMPPQTEEEIRKRWGKNNVPMYCTEYSGTIDPSHHPDMYQRIALVHHRLIIHTDDVTCGRRM